MFDHAMQRVCLLDEFWLDQFLLDE